MGVGQEYETSYSVVSGHKVPSRLVSSVNALLALLGKGSWTLVVAEGRFQPAIYPLSALQAPGFLPSLAEAKNGILRESTKRYRCSSVPVTALLHTDCNLTKHMQLNVNMALLFFANADYELDRVQQWPIVIQLVPRISDT